MSQRTKKATRWGAVRTEIDFKERLDEVARKRAVLESRRITSKQVLDEILGRELPKIEKKLIAEKALAL